MRFRETNKPLTWLHLIIPPFRSIPEDLMFNWIRSHYACSSKRFFYSLGYHNLFHHQLFSTVKKRWMSKINYRSIHSPGTNLKFDLFWFSIGSRYINDQYHFNSLTKNSKSFITNISHGFKKISNAQIWDLVMFRKLMENSISFNSASDLKTFTIN